MEGQDKSKNSRKTDFHSPGAADLGDDLTGILGERLENISEAIEEIDGALDERGRMSSRFITEIEEETKDVLRHIKGMNPPWKTGFHPELEFLRLSLHKSLTSRKKDKRTEELKLWEDVTGLVKDKRKLLDEYKALLATQKRLVR